MSKNETFLSIVLIVKNKAPKLADYIPKLSRFLNEGFSDYEILVVDKNSSDETAIVMDEHLKQYRAIPYIMLSEFVEHDVAIAAGVENAIGDFVFNINIDSDNVTIILPLLKLAEAGNDIVIATCKKASSPSYRLIRTLSKSYIHSIGYTLPNNSTGTFCLSRLAVNAITETGRYYCKFFSRMANLGFPMTNFECDEHIQALSKKRVLHGITETLHYTVFNSTKPLRWMSLLGILGSLFAMVFSMYSVILHFVRDEVAPGWTTTILFMSSLFIVLFTMLSFFGEYLSRLLNDRGNHREYSVVFEKNSSVMVLEERHNVLFSSEKKAISNEK